MALNPQPANTLSRKVELAAQSYIQSLDQSFEPNGVVTCGKSSILKTGYAIVCYAENAKYDANNSGGAHVTLHVIIKYPMDPDTDNVDPTTVSDPIVTTIFNAFSLGYNQQDLTAVADLLNQQEIPDLTVMTTQRLEEEAHAEEGRVWVETLTVDCYAIRLSGA